MLQLSTTGALVVDDSISTSVKSTNAGDTFTLSSINSGELFGLYSIEFASASAGDKQVVVHATTMQGDHISQTFTVHGGTGFQRFVLDRNFASVKNVSWTAGDLMVDNVFAQVFSQSQATQVNDVATAILGDVITINTDYRTISGQSGGLNGVSVSASLVSGGTVLQFASLAIS